MLCKFLKSMLLYYMDYIKQDEVDKLIKEAQGRAVAKPAAEPVTYKVFKFNCEGLGGIRVVSEKWARENFRPLDAEVFPCKE